MRVGYDQVQIDIFVAVQLYSAVKGIILEDMVFQPQLLDDPGGCDRLQVPPPPSSPGPQSVGDREPWWRRRPKSAGTAPAGG